MAEIDESRLIPDAGTQTPLKKYAPEEMVTCETCLRANPPTRSQCMYCGAGLLPTEELAADVSETRVDERKANYYVVLRTVKGQAIAETVLDDLATRFHLKSDDLQAALSTGAPLPLAIASSEEESERVANELKTQGLESISVSDAHLKSDIAPRNIHLLEFSDAGLAGISKNGREHWLATWQELSLIVFGRLLMHRLEVDEKRSRGSAKSLDRRELTQDRSVIDLYSTSNDAPWRIVVNEFDFSCLGERKLLTAFDNVRVLIDLLTSRSNAEINDSYARVKATLGNVWPLQSATKEGRSQRPRAGRNEISTVTASDNESQFNNYSRMVWCWKGLEGTPSGEKRSINF